MKKIITRLLLLCLGLYLVICAVLYLFQEKLLFIPQRLAPGHQFLFPGRYEVINIPVDRNVQLRGLLFHADSSKGLVFYVHGNAGSVQSWGALAPVYTALGYDVLFWDYRGYGRSDGRISNMEQLFADVQAVYDTMRTRYREDSIVVLGYSIGSGLACHLAAGNHPRMLILQAPYYSLPDMMAHEYPFVPGFLLRYPIRTDQYIRHCNMPVILFHGDRDEVIYYGSALKLQALLKPGDTLITLPGQRHNGITANEDYLRALDWILR